MASTKGKSAKLFKVLFLIGSGTPDRSWIIIFISFKRHVTFNGSWVSFRSLFIEVATVSLIFWGQLEYLSCLGFPQLGFRPTPFRPPTLLNLSSLLGLPSSSFHRGVDDGVLVTRFRGGTRLICALNSWFYFSRVVMRSITSFIFFMISMSWASSLEVPVQTSVLLREAWRPIFEMVWK